MPRSKKRRHPPTEGAYTLRDLYGGIGMRDLMKMVPYEGKPTKDALVDELVRSTPLDQLDSISLKQICAAFGVSGGGKKEAYLTRLKKHLRQDAPEVPVALAVEMPNPNAADEEGSDHLKDKETCSSSTSKDRRAATSSDKDAASLRNEGGNAGQKRKPDGNVAESNLDKRTKHTKEEVAEPKAVANASSDDFSIKRCISVLNTMGELSNEEKVESFEVFKDAQNREIFLCAEPAQRILWLRRKIDTQTPIEYGYGPL